METNAESRTHRLANVLLWLRHHDAERAGRLEPELEERIARCAEDDGGEDTEVMDGVEQALEAHLERMGLEGWRTFCAERCESVLLGHLVVERARQKAWRERVAEGCRRRQDLRLEVLDKAGCSIEDLAIGSGRPGSVEAAEAQLAARAGMARGRDRTVLAAVVVAAWKGE